MADIQSNINVNVDTSGAISAIKNLQREISAVQQDLNRGTATQVSAAAKQQQNLINNLNATRMFSAEIKNIKTTTESFTSALEKNKLSLGQYFRYSLAATKSFGGAFQNEMNVVDKVARERVKSLQTQYIKLGRDANGAMKAIAVRPLMLDMDNLATKTAIAAQKQQILNQLIQQGSTNLLNFGKNTQWAGRQLMVGFTIPLVMAGTAAAKAYMQIEQASVNIRRVYGDLSTSVQETNQMVKSIQNLAAEYTKYGIAVADTMAMAAKAAAMGKTGVDLLAQVNQATKLAALGGVDQNTALETTISLTNAFGTSAEQLAGKIDFLNAVENQTVLSIEDMTTAIPKAAPVVKQLGGSVEDLTFFLTAMKEGGINASEGANALKSGLSALINPTKKASDFLAGFGVNVTGIVEKDKGNLKKTVIDFASALDKIDPLNRARAIEMMFGKFQFARISTLLKNVTDQGSQATKVAGLASMSAIQLAAISRKELDKISSSPMYKFQKAMADLQLKLAPVGEAFLKAITPVIGFVSKILDGFNGMSDQFKGFVVVGSAILGGLVPVLLMVTGLVANGAANIIKFFAGVRGFFSKTAASSKILGEATNYLTEEQIQAEAVAASLDQIHSKLIQTFSVERESVDLLTAAYNRSIAAQAGMGMGPTVGRTAAKGFATGGIVHGPGTSTSDSVPANLSNGEVVLSVDVVRKNPALIGALLSGKKVNVPGYAKNGVAGSPGVSVYGGPSRMLGGLAAYLPGNNSTFGMNRTLLTGSDNTLLSQRLTGAAVGGAFAIDRKSGMFGGSRAKLTTKLMDEYGDAVKDYIPEIIKVLKSTEVSMTATGKDASKIDHIVAEAKPEMQKIFDSMKAKGGKTASAAIAISEHMMYPTPDAMESMGEHRVPAARETREGKIKTTQFRAVKSRFVGSVKTASEYFGPRISSEEQYAHFNGASIPGPQYPVAGGAFGPQVSEERRSKLLGALDTKITSISNSTTNSDIAKITQAAKASAQKKEKALSDGWIAGAKTQGQEASPAKVAIQSGKNHSLGFTDGTKLGLVEAKIAGERLAATATKGMDLWQPLRQTPEKNPYTMGDTQATAGRPKRGPSPFLERMRASVAAAPSNFANEKRMLSNEAKSIFEQLKGIFKIGGKNAVVAAETGLIQETPRLKVAGKEAGFDYVAALKGGNGSIAAVITAGNQKIISKALEEYNAGGYKIAGAVSLGLDRGIAAELGRGIVAGERVAQSIADGATKAAKPGKMPRAERGFIGPLPEGQKRDRVTEANSKLANANTKFAGMMEKAQNGVASKFAKIGGAATTAAFAMSMMPGPIGQAMQVMTPYIGILTGLSAITGIFDAEMLTATISIGLLEVPVWAVVAGLAALAAVFAAGVVISNQINEQKQQELKHITASSAAYQNANKAISELGKLSGVTPSNAMATARTALNAGLNTKQASDVNILLNSAEFKDKGSAISSLIGNIKDMSNTAAKDFLAAYANQLKGAGFDEKTINSILNAIKLKANKTNLKLDFASVDINTKAGRTQVSKGIQDSLAGTSSKTIDEYNKRKADILNDPNNRDINGKLISSAYTSQVKELNKDPKFAAMNDSLKSGIGAVQGNLSGALSQFASGSMSKSGFAASLKSITDGLAKSSAKASVLKNVLATMGPAATASGNKITLLSKHAKEAGVKFDTTSLQLKYFAIVSANPTLGKELSAKLAALKDDANGTAQALKLVNSYTDKLSGGSGGNIDNYKVDTTAGGGGGTDPKQLLKDTQAQVAANTLNQSLMKKNYNSEFIDAITSADAATQKYYFTLVNGKKVLNEQGKALLAAFNTKVIGDFLIAQGKLVSGASQELAARKQLTAAGLSAEDVKTMAARSDVQAALAAANATEGAKARAAAVKKVTDALKAEKTATDSLLTKQDQFQKVYDSSTKALDTQSSIISNSFDTNATNVANQAKILKANQDIQDLQTGAGKTTGLNQLNNGLSQIQFIEADINKKYDDRAKALDKVSKINQRIVDQQKGQLSLAQALSSGDIAAAAQAAQDMNAQNASQSAADQKQALDDAKQKELDSVTTTVNGKLMTRKEIEDASKGIQEQILQIQIKQLEPAQTAYDLAARARDASLKAITDQKLAWDGWKLSIDEATQKLDKYNKAVKDAGPLAGAAVNEINANGNSTTAAAKRQASDAAKAARANDVRILANPKSTAAQRTAAQAGITWFDRTYSGFATGGHVTGAGTGTSDSIPAWLSNGEYVIKASSVKKIGLSNLEAMNNAPAFANGGSVRSNNSAAKDLGVNPSDYLVNPNNPMSGIGQGMQLAMDAIWNQLTGPFLMNLRKNKLTTPTVNDAMTLGGNLLPTPKLKTLKAIPLFLDIAKDVSRAVNKDGLKALVQTLKMTRRSIPTESSQLIDPLLRVQNAGSAVNGPGTYFAKNIAANFGKWNAEYGTQLNKTKLSPSAALAIAKSKGYIAVDELKAIAGNDLNSLTMGSPAIQNLLKQGYVGVEDKAGKAFTSWIMGSQKGFGVKKLGDLSTADNSWLNPNGIQAIQNNMRKAVGKTNSLPYFMSPNVVTKEFFKGVVGDVKTKLSPAIKDTGIDTFSGMQKVEGSTGGYVTPNAIMPKYFANGGIAQGTDTVPAMLTPGEFVVKKFAVDNFGVDNLRAINSGATLGTNNSSVGMSSNSSVGVSTTNYDGSVYNYSVNVNVKSDANPDQIAQAVMMKINQTNGQRIRGNRLNG